MPRFRWPMLDISIKNVEYAIAIQDYIATRQEIQDITGRVGQTFVLIGVVPVAATAVGGQNNPNLNLVASVILPVIIYIAMYMILWLSFRQVLLVAHAKRLTQYFLSAFSDEDFHGEILYRYDKESPLIKVFSLRWAKDGGYKPYTLHVIIASVLVLALLIIVAIVSCIIIKGYSELGAMVYLLIQLLIIASIAYFWWTILVTFNQEIDVAIDKYSPVKNQTPTSR